MKTQQAIVQKLDALSAETKRLEAIYEKKIEDLVELKKAILQKAFNGELPNETAEITPRQGMGAQTEIAFLGMRRFLTRRSTALLCARHLTFDLSRFGNSGDSVPRIFEFGSIQDTIKKYQVSP